MILLCKLCGKYFERGTTTLSSSFCDKCLVNVQTVNVERTREEEIKNCIDLARECKIKIKACEKTIEENKEIIKFAEQEIEQLKKEEHTCDFGDERDNDCWMCQKYDRR